MRIGSDARRDLHCPILGAPLLRSQDYHRVSLFAFNVLRR